MTRKPAKNLPASVHQRLLNLAKETGRPFNEILQHYGLERFLFRLSGSRYRESLILKGALSFAVRDRERPRPTKDIDFLGITDNTVENIENIVRELCGIEVQPDGLAFHPETVKGRSIVEDAEYSGVRVTFMAYLGNAEISMQVDVGFGDKVTPEPEDFDYPTILDDLPSPHVLRYTRETIVAEKLEAMTKLGELNSRIRDFYDIWYLSHEFPFDGALLSTAVKTTFQTRGTEIEARPVALTTVFSENPEKEAAYQAFIRRSQIVDAPSNLSELTDLIAGFLGPILEALTAGKDFDGQWKPPGPWTASDGTSP